LGVFPEQRNQPLRRFNGIVLSVRDPFEKEVQPGFPIALRSRLIEQSVALAAMLFEVRAQVQERLLHNAFMVQDEGDEQPSDPAARSSIAVLSTPPWRLRLPTDLTPGPFDRSR